ncbi:PIN domain nuclease, partial [Enterococcus faecalis]|nr:PIN domain nuclease [Enterococcus faecalis]
MCIRDRVVKAGTERQQGVVYLDDVTMVVVEDGQHYMHEQIEVVVTITLQTAAGRMFFPKPAHPGRGMNDRTANHLITDK